MSNYIRFDWAMRRLLRDKANFAVLEGLMTTLMKKKKLLLCLSGTDDADFTDGTKNKSKKHI